MIIKSFIKEGSGFFGQDIKSWTNEFNKVEKIVESAADAERDYLSPFFKRFFPLPPGKILEGGCGTGRYVITYRKIGYDIIGVDFSGETIRRIKKECGEDFAVYEANITALPFEDNYFDCYYSGGVIEHFEAGPDMVLQEAHRVIKKGGILLATVPYVNLIRRFYFTIFPAIKTNRILLKRVKGCQPETGVPKRYNFCEYYFDVNSLAHFFKRNGFLIEKTYPIDILYGEIGLLLQKFIKRNQNCRQTTPINSASCKSNTIKTNNKRPLIKAWLYDFLITENRNNIFYKLPLTFINYLSGHMILFVARAI